MAVCLRTAVRSRRSGKGSRIRPGIWVAILGVAVSATWQPAGASTPNWAKAAPTNTPAARAFGQMATDPVTGQTVYFGGWDGAQDQKQTWLWVGSNWVLQHPAASPAARELGGFAYDPATKETLLFGGFSARANRPLGDSWSWSGTNWLKVAPKRKPSPRFGMGIAYDAATKQLLMFGGQTNLSTTFSGLNDTWQWTGATWKLLKPTTKPPARSYFALGYDASSQQLVLFGGSGTSGALADTWTWSGTNWVQQHPTLSPSARYADATSFDPIAGQLVVFGGTATTGSFPQPVFSDTWAWGGTNWAKLAPTTTPPGRAFHAVAFDSSSSKLLLFGGVGSIINRFGDGPELGDTWTYS